MRETWIWHLRPPSLVKGCIGKQKKERDLGLNERTVTAINYVLSTTVQTGPTGLFGGPISTTGRAQLVLHDFIRTPIVTK